MSRLSLQQKRQENVLTISQSLPSTSPSDYSIERRDYSRSNSDERLYKIKWWPTLMRLYDCRCALCDEDRDGMELDHFWIPKSHGGNLVLRHQLTNQLVNNAAPLCTTCNRHKEQSIIDLNDPQLEKIARANRQITAMINGVYAVEPLAKLHRYEPGDERRALGVEGGYLPYMAQAYRSDPNPSALAMLKHEINIYLLVERF
jgi:hypothetical protein